LVIVNVRSLLSPVTTSPKARRVLLRSQSAKVAGGWVGVPPPDLEHDHRKRAPAPMTAAVRLNRKTALVMLMAESPTGAIRVVVRELKEAPAERSRASARACGRASAGGGR
jgi:hypothetical protein